jgi:hypothetical protein
MAAHAVRPAHLLSVAQGAEPQQQDRRDRRPEQQTVPCRLAGTNQKGNSDVSTLTTTSPAATGEGESPCSLPEPVKNEGPHRTIKYEWDIGDAGEGKRRMAVLSISHHTAGPSLFSGSSHPNHFSATLRNEDVNARSRTTSLFSGHSIDQEAISRFSQKRLEVFAERALQKLRELHSAQDAAVLAYFQHEDEQASAA